jgi:hypothetical protein
MRDDGAVVLVVVYGQDVDRTERVARAEARAERVEDLIEELLRAGVLLGHGRSAGDLSGHVVSEDAGDVAVPVRPGAERVGDDPILPAEADFPQVPG